MRVSCLKHYHHGVSVFFRHYPRSPLSPSTPPPSFQFSVSIAFGQLLFRYYVSLYGTYFNILLEANSNISNFWDYNLGGYFHLPVFFFIGKSDFSFYLYFGSHFVMRRAYSLFTIQESLLMALRDHIGCRYN